jgi:hypothetical protein
LQLGAKAVPELLEEFLIAREEPAQLALHRLGQVI